MIHQRISARINRIRFGNYGDHKLFLGIIEIRMHFGRRYCLYCAEDGDEKAFLSDLSLAARVQGGFSKLLKTSGLN